MTGTELAGGATACAATAVAAVLGDWFAGNPSSRHERRGDPPAAGTAGIRRPLMVRAMVIAACAVASSALVYARIGCLPPLPAACCLCAVAPPLAASDLAAHRLPDRLTLPAIAVTAVLLSAASWQVDNYAALGRAAVGTAAAAAFFLTLALITGQVGGGDVKLGALVAMLPAWLGWDHLVLGLLAGLLLAALTAVVLITTRRLSRHDPLPLGPFLLAGALLGVLA